VCLGALDFMQQQLRRSERVQLAHCGHFGPLEAASALSGVLERFVVGA
jgi:hypothetical protein